MTRIKRQHFVPRFYLQAFAAESRPSHVWVYDKEQGRRYLHSIAKVASRRQFYDSAFFDGDTESQVVEKYLSRLEGYASRVIREILEDPTGESFKSLGQPKRRVLVEFIATQLMRTNEARLALMQQKEHLPPETLNRPDSVEQLRALETKDGQAALHSALIFSDKTVPVIEEHLHRASWALLRNETCWPFLTSDNPVVYAPPCEVEPGQHYTIRTPGVMTMYPLSPTRILVFASLEDRCAPLFSRAKQEHVLHFNGLQVDKSTNQIYGPTQDFRLVESRLMSRPDVVGTNRPRIPGTGPEK